MIPNKGAGIGAGASLDFEGAAKNDEAGMEGEAVGVVDRTNGVVTNLGGVLTSGELAKKLGIPEPELDTQASYLLCECAVCIKCI